MNIKKVTHEDHFARKYYCNSYRFVHTMNRKNRKKFRKVVKKETQEEVKETINSCC